MMIEQVPDDLKFKDYFRLQFAFFKWTGVPIEPLDKYNDFEKALYFGYCVFAAGFVGFLFWLTEGIHLFMNVHDMYKFSFTLSYFISHSMGVLKVILLLIKRKSIYNYLQKLESGVFKPDMRRCGIVEFELIKKAIWITNFQTLFFFAVASMVIFNRILDSLFDKGHLEEFRDEERNITTTKLVKTMPFMTWFPFDNNVSPYYEFGVVYHALGAWIYAIYIGGADTTITGIIIHVKAQFTILKRSLETYLQRAEEMVKNEENAIRQSTSRRNLNSILNEEKEEEHLFVSESVRNRADKMLKECIYHHQQIIMISTMAEEEFSLLILVQFLGSLVLICFQLFQLSLLNPNSFAFLSMTFYLVVMLFELLLYCWNGNEVRLIGISIADSVYNSNWTLLDESTKKLTVLMMLRAQKPVKFTAGKFVFLTLETFINILRGSASYFMVLNRINN